MINLSSQVRNYIAAAQSLCKTSRGGEFRIELPPGTRLVLNVDGRDHEITDRNLNDPDSRPLFMQGALKEVRLDLPQDLRQDNPANLQRIRRLQEWLSTTGERVDQALKQLETVRRNPQSVIMYGDQEASNRRGRFRKSEDSSHGEFLGVAGPDYQVVPDEQLGDINLVAYSASVKNLGNNRYLVNQTVQAQMLPWYCYQDFRFPGFSAVGKPMNIPPREMSGDDCVAVSTGHRIEIVQVKNLDEFLKAQKFAYWGEKILTTSLDAAMLASGTIEVMGAVRAARFAASGATQALRLTRAEAAWQFANGSSRMLAGGSGALNSTWGRSSEFGTGVNMMRGAYFLTEAGYGLAHGGYNFFRAAKQNQPLSAAEKIQIAIHGQPAKDGFEALKGIPFIRHVHTGTNFTFRASEYIFAPVIAAEIGHHVKNIREHGQRDPAADAIAQVGLTLTILHWRLKRLPMSVHPGCLRAI